MSRGYLEEVRRRLLEKGVDPKSQFLSFEHNFSPKQHYKLSPLQDLGNLELFKPRVPCLKSITSVEKRQSLACYGCGSCAKVDLNNLRLPSYFNRSEKNSHRDWLLSRPLGLGASLSSVKSAKVFSKPSFFYSFIFKVGREGRLVTKEVLVRLWLKAWAGVDDRAVTSFRKLVYSFSSRMDYPDMVSNYYGFEAVVAGFQTPLDLNGFEGVRSEVNARCPTINLVKVSEVCERPSVPGYWALSVLRLRVSLEGVIDCFLKSPFRFYKGSTSKYQAVPLPFYYSPGSGGNELRLCFPVKVNPAYSLLEYWSYNKFNKMLLEQEVLQVLLPLGDGMFLDAVSNSNKALDSFIYIDREEINPSDTDPVLTVTGA